MVKEIRHIQLYEEKHGKKLDPVQCADYIHACKPNMTYIDKMNLLNYASNYNTPSYSSMKKKIPEMNKEYDGYMKECLSGRGIVYLGSSLSTLANCPLSY